MSFEIFVPIKGFEDYSVSNYGRVKSYKIDKVNGILLKGGCRGYYKCVTVDYKPKSIHRLVAQAFLEDWNEDLYVDHSDGNKQNNNVKNLRMATKKQNQHNRKGTKNSSSKYKGVSWNKQHKKWAVRIYVNNKNKHLGYFDVEDEAGKAYDFYAKNYHKKFANLNF